MLFFQLFTHRFTGRTNILSLIILLAIQNSLSADNKSEHKKQENAIIGTNRIPGENWVNKLAPEERKYLCGTFLEPLESVLAKMISLPQSDNLPAVFDWRDNNGNWLTPVKNQGLCGSCWCFSAVAQVESWWKIYHAYPDSMIDLSEQFVLSGSMGSCSGGYIADALNYIKSNGIPSEECFEYHGDDQIPLSDSSEHWQDQMVKIPGWGYITFFEANINIIKSAVYRQPVAAGIKVYQDFFDYQPGTVYEHEWGDWSGGHAVLIVGWNDEEQSWICKNSWVENWGEEGYFRIRWDECNIGEKIPFIWNELTGSNALVYSPHKFNFNITVGDSVTDTLTVTNSGTDVLEYSAMDISNSGHGASWLDITNGAGTLQPNASGLISIMINTQYLEPGSWPGKIRISSNDTTLFPIKINCNLELSPLPNELSDQVDHFPQICELYQNYPNPFNPKTVISWQLAFGSQVELSIYNILGEKVTTLVSQQQTAGYYEVKWDANGFASGVYFCVLMTSRGFRQTKKLILVK
jgi:C1A family cysteine protease